MEIKKFGVEFVERTKHILANYNGEYEVSNLLNCTLGLLILPYERIQDNTHTFWDTNVGNIPDLAYLNISLFEPIKKFEDGHPVYYPKTLKILLKKIRNGLAHQHIEPVNNTEQFEGVIIRNYYAKRHPDLEIQFTAKELERFALFIADEYLRLAQ